MRLTLCLRSCRRAFGYSKVQKAFSLIQKKKPFWHYTRFHLDFDSNF